MLEIRRYGGSQRSSLSLSLLLGWLVLRWNPSSITKQ
jgi:hypothetical protein